MYKHLFILFISLCLINCSQINRTSVSSVDSATLRVLLDGIIDDLPSFGSEIDELAYAENSVIYFGEGSVSPEVPANMSPEALFAFTNLEFFEVDLTVIDLEQARVIFTMNEATEQYSLVMDVLLTVDAENTWGKQMITKYYRQVDELYLETDKWTQNKKFEMVLEDTITGEYIYLKTFDVNAKDELKPTIQLEVWTEVNGQFYITVSFCAEWI